MSEEMENIEEVSVEEALQMEIIFNQALMDVLVSKGVITEQEVLDRVEEVRRETGFEEIKSQNSGRSKGRNYWRKWGGEINAY